MLDHQTVVAIMRWDRLFLVIAALAVAVWWFGSSGGFSDADIAAMKKSIKAEFEKKSGYTVSDVVMMKESSNKATGFVKVSTPYAGEVMKSCSATMAAGGRDYMWKCD